MQDMAMRLRYAQVPVVAALAGMALGGGCELSVHCATRVAHFETYLGLVEAGIGLVPGSGGLSYCARRAAQQQAESAPDAPLRSEEHTSELQSLMRTSYAVFSL